MRLKRFFIIPLSILLIGCEEKQESKTQYDPVIPVEVSVADFSNGANTRSYVGSVNSEVKIGLVFPLGGTITDIYVHNGQMVKKGDIIAKVDETTAKSLHEVALATLNQAEDGYRRMKQVYDEGGISDVRWVQMETDLEKARQSEISTRKHYEDCTIYAPQDGVVSMGERVIGEVMRPSEPLCYLYDMDRLRVEFSVPEKEIGMINIGDKAVAEINALDDKERDITISDKSIVSNPFGHTYSVKAKINIDDKSVLPGMVVKIRLNSTAMNGIIVPASCVHTMPGGQAVWKVKDGKAYRQIIGVGDFVKNGVLVTDGLDYGDTIVTVGYQKLYNGARVSF